MGEAAQTRMPETQLFRDVFNASPIGVVVENLEGHLLFVNPAFCSFLGFSEEELRNGRCSIVIARIALESGSRRHR